MKIRSIHARWILDSRGLPTVEADVVSESGIRASAAVPSGASTGSHEALELRDGEPDHFNGKGVLQAIKNIHDVIAPKVIEVDLDQRQLDDLLCELAGENKKQLGANATLAISLAYAKVAALEQGKALHQYIHVLCNVRPESLPMPMFNIINGGKHASRASDIQEYMIMPLGAQTMADAIETGSEVFHALRSILVEKNYSVSVGDEGGFAPPIEQPEQVLETILLAIEKAGFKADTDVSICLDVAASELWNKDHYEFSAVESSKTTDEMQEWLSSLVASYPIISIEDGFAEDEWDAWQNFTERLGDGLQIVGDDLLVTNPAIVSKAIENKSANAVLIKPNQIGTLSETLDCITMAQRAGWKTVISHRSGETEDVTIAHIATGSGAAQIKSGSLSRTERLSKYNELLRIAERNPELVLHNPFVSR